ncbi:MAG: tetratricopeptide repeat-containing sulfotransferase family protein [Rhizomicrobium sp.]
MQSPTPTPGPTLQAPDIAFIGPNAESDPLAKMRRDLYEAQPIRDPKLLAVADALEDGREAEANKIAEKFLARHPWNADALNLMAEIAQRSRNPHLAEEYLGRCVRSAPGHVAYRYNYAVALMELNKLNPALDEIEILLAKSPLNALFRAMKGHLLNRTGRYAEGAHLFRELTAEIPDSVQAWMGLAASLRALGRHSDEAISCLRKVVCLDPGAGSAWWALASMKTSRLTPDDVRTMEAQLANPAVGALERIDLYYALGKACDDVKQYEKAFRYYSKGNAIRRIGLAYNPDSTTSMVDRARAVFTPELFRAREDAGYPSAEPIFVVGLQRSGTTLTEQILGAHSQIEFAGELKTMVRIVGEDVMPKTGPNYPSGMDRLTPDDLRSLGEKYLEYTRTHRPKGKPFFVDKNCYNIWQIGLIRLMLPNAKIIDVRRHPVACCWANYTVSFSHAPPLSYKLTDIGRFYRDYVRLMAHYDRAMPGKIHRVIYENLVADLEGEVRHMLDFLELPFEPGCLEYYKSDRAFNSFSNEQVRRPIFKDGVERWRAFEPWLGPLKATLGPLLDAYPAVPEFPD